MRKQGCTTVYSYQNCSCSTLKIHVTCVWLGNSALDDQQQFHHNATHQTCINDRSVCKGKGKGHPRTGHESPEGEQIYSSTLPSTSPLDGGWMINANAPAALPPRKDPVPIVQETAWVWTGAENLASIGIRSPDGPVRKESLYRLSYRGPPLCIPFWISEDFEGSEERLFFIGTRVSVCPVTQLVGLSSDTDKRKALTVPSVTEQFLRPLAGSAYCISHPKIVQIVLNPKTDS